MYFVIYMFISIYLYNNNKQKHIIMSKFKFKVISIQTWNNNNEQLLSEHKSLRAAEKMVTASSKKSDGNRYAIRPII